MNEAEFDALIDCNLPYNNRAECERLMDVAKTISDEALFMVLHEICRGPRGANTTKENLAALAKTWQRKSEHPLTDALYQCAQTMIRGRWLSVSDAVNLANQIALHPGQWSALNIACFSCDDTDGHMEYRYDQIQSDWSKG